MIDSIRKNLLWFDGSGALVAGILVLFLTPWLSELHSLPRNLLYFTGAINILYSFYSLPLAFMKNRTVGMVSFLAIANMAWMPVCFVLGFLYLQEASVFGLIHLFGEGVFVGGLGFVEWRLREELGSSN